MAFTDNFNRSNENLEVSSNWTRVDGNAGDASIVSNALNGNSTVSNGALYLCPDQGSTDQFTQVVLNSSSESFCVNVRSTDNINWISARHAAGSGVWELFKRVSGSFTSLGTFSATFVSGDVIKLTANDSDELEVFINATSRIGPVTETFNNTVTRQGLLPRGGTVSNWLDDFEAGVLAAPGNPWNYYAQM